MASDEARVTAKWNVIVIKIASADPLALARQPFRCVFNIIFTTCYVSLFRMTSVAARRSVFVMRHMFRCW